ncbi:Lipid phosphate phosphatase [Vigna angularis]|uniref:Lipid phosphate phosphatase n=1 Tax=Phaseolus angularis TaxID=3914 RepID=A0A8T0JP94_PHAAN|nr:Lipid phosphate phosphatase [Vigna angularis]
MPEDQLSRRTIRSHGAKVARRHMQDWLILLLLAIIDAILNVIEPFHRFVGQGMMTDLSYPLKDNTIPFWAVPDGDLVNISKHWLILILLRILRTATTIFVLNKLRAIE